MRKFAAIAIAGGLALTGAACGGDDDGGSASGFCNQAEAVDEMMSETEDEITDEQLDQIRELADDAPSEIRDDMQLFVEVMEALSEGDFTALEDFDEAEMTAAGENIESFLEDECGIEPDDSEE